MSKTELPFTAYQKVVTIVACALVVLMWVFVLCAYPALPEEIPGHYNAAGEVTRYDGKGIIFIMPAISTLLVGTCVLLSFFPDAWNTVRVPTPERRRKVLHATRDLLATMTCAFAAMFAGLTLTMSGVIANSAWLLPCMLVLVSVVMVVGIVRVVRAQK